MNKPKSMSRKVAATTLGSLMALGLLFVPGKSVFAAGDVDISTAFPDANFANYIAYNFDDGDGKLTQAECDAVKIIDVSNKGIEDLTGLKYFKNLENLDCSDNPSLGALDVDGNTNLKKLKCYNTGIADLELTYNTALEYLDPTSPNLEYLNITGCTKLIDIVRNSSTPFHNTGRLNEWGDFWAYSSSVNVLCINVGITLEPCIACEAVFPDDNFREEIKSKVDKNDDIVLDKSEISSIEQLLLMDKGISDLTGIEYFPDLKELECSKNNLTSAPLSKLPKLEKFRAHSNQFVNIDASNNPNLRYLDVSGTATVKNIDISNCAYLKDLMATGTRKETEYNGVSAYQYGDPLAKDYLEYAQASDINAIAINRLHFPDSNFRSYILLNLDNNSDNYLSSTEIGKVKILSIGNKNISKLDGIEFFTELEDLTCSNNKLSKLDLSANLKVEGIDCDDNNLTSINLGKNKNSLSLSCANNKLKSLDLSELTGLDILWCSGNKDLTSLDLSKNTELAWLTCFNTGLSSLDVSKNTKLKKIDVHGTKISEIDATMCPDLHYLDVSLASVKKVNIYSNPKVLMGYKDGVRQNKTESGVEFYEYRYDKDGKLGVLRVDKDAAVVDVEPTATPTATPTTKPTTKPADASISLDKKTANVKCGDKLTLKATVKNTTDKVTWKSSDTKVATVSKEGKITTKMAGQTTITATVAGKSAKCVVTVLYKDVTNTKDFWYAPTNYLTAKNVVKGYDKQTKFKPANDCTRAQMVTFLWRLQGEPEPTSATCKFKDVKKSDYFFKPVIWAVEEGITTGVSKTKFNPQGVCTRAQTVTFLWRMAEKPDPKTTKNKFKDVKKKDYFYKATLWASENKILAGYKDGTFQPQGKCLRRQMVTFLYKYDKFINGKG